MAKSKHTKEFRMFMESIRSDLICADQFLGSRNAFEKYSIFGEQTKNTTLTVLEYFLECYGSDRSSDDIFSLSLGFRWLAEVIITRFIGFFDYYISQVLKSVFQQKPDQLKGSKIDMEELLDVISKSGVIHRSDLFQIYTDKKLHDLGYKGLFKLIEYLNRNLGLDVKSNTEVFRRAKSFIQVRNIIVHNAGRVDKSYLDEAGQTTLKIGELHPFTEGTYIRDGMIAIFTIVEDIDTQLITKFDLPNIEEIDAKGFRSRYLLSDSDPAIEDSQEGFEP